MWGDVDPKRCGTLPFVFSADFCFEKYVNWMLDVPMFHALRHGSYIDATGLSFRDFMNGELEACPGV